MRQIILPALAGFALLLAGCGNKQVTRANFDKVEPGMSLSEVQRLLGKGDLEDAGGGVNIGATGISGSSGQRGDEVYIWRSGDAEIRITFRDGKVVDKLPKGL